MSHAQMFELQRQIGRPFTWTALLTFAGSNYHEQVMAEHRQPGLLGLTCGRRCHVDPSSSR